MKSARLTFDMKFYLNCVFCLVKYAELVMKRRVSEDDIGYSKKAARLDLR